VHVLTHTGTWVPGRACRYDGLEAASQVFMEFDAPIKPGTSGSPVIDDNGLLVGVISQSIEGGHKSDGPVPCPHLALPVWVRNRICAE
jgi:S1-C subfamily serine protease